MATTRRTQAQRREETEARLLDAACRIIGDRGVRGVTTAAVGELAGYSRGIVNHHFGSRDALMVRLAETAQARFSPNPHELRGMPHVLGIVDDYLAAIRDDPVQARVFLRLWAAAVGNDEPSLREAFVQRDAHFRTVFEGALSEGVADRTIRPDLDIAATAVALVGLVRGIAMQWQFSPELATTSTAQSIVHNLIHASLH